MTVGRLSNNVFLTFQLNWQNFEKKSLNGHSTVVGGHATVGRLSKNFFRPFKQIGNFLKKVAERSRDSRRRSRDRRPTDKLFYFDVSTKMAKFKKKPLNCHATIVGGHVTVGRLSNNFFRRFKRIRENLKNR